MGISRSSFFFYLSVFSKLSTMNDFADLLKQYRSGKAYYYLTYVACLLDRHNFQNGSLWEKTIT